MNKEICFISSPGNGLSCCCYQSEVRNPSPTWSGKWNEAADPNLNPMQAVETESMVEVMYIHRSPPDFCSPHRDLQHQPACTWHLRVYSPSDPRSVECIHSINTECSRAVVQSASAAPLQVTMLSCSLLNRLDVRRVHAIFPPS